MPTNAMTDLPFPEDLAAHAAAEAGANDQHTLYDQDAPLTGEEVQFHLQQVALEERQQYAMEPPNFDFKEPTIEPATINIEL